MKRYSFVNVPDEQKTEKLCMEIIDGSALQYVPWGQINLSVPAMAELCMEAVRQYGPALEYVPWGQINLSVPATAELCLEAVKQYGSALRFVPEKLKTQEMCLEAVKQNSAAFEYVPKKLRDKVRSMLASSLADREDGTD